MLRLLFLLALTALLPALPASAASEDGKLETLETKHYRIGFGKKHGAMAGEILRIAEAVWPILAKAYDSYDHYQRIDILITDDGDDANGYAIYNFSRVAIYAPHMDWVMRNRQAWLRNVVTHELAHIFSLRRAARLSPVDAVNIYGSTYNARDRINYSFQIPWIPLIAPAWYIEGVAQFEAFENGNDSWDSQRDMVLRDAYLTGTLPTLDLIETFEGDEDWTQAERCYNTGYAFLLYLKDRFGADKVRALARPKPFFNFSYSVEKALGRNLADLFEDFKRSLSDRYVDFKEIPLDPVADADMRGGFQQDLAFSRDGRYMAWLGNDDGRRYPLNWIFWKDLRTGETGKSAKPTDNPGPASPSVPAPAPPESAPGPGGSGNGTGGAYGSPGLRPAGPGPLGLPAAGPRPANPTLALGKLRPFAHGAPARLRAPALHAAPGPAASGHAGAAAVERSREAGSAGLEFNRRGTKLLTTRQDRFARYTDIWEYDFRSRQSETDKWHRLTWEERAAYPSYHPYKDLIVYSRKRGGSSNLVILDSAGRGRQLTHFSGGEQVYNPRFTPKGDSVYFTLGIDDKEAIVALDAGAPEYDAFADRRDSTLFPDSLKVAGNQRLDFITPLEPAGIRNLRFSHDTLFWSSNAESDGYRVYDVFARIPGDSVAYRATRVSGQALEPLVHEGDLYYQGYRKQQFRIFRRALELTRTGSLLRPRPDSLPIAKRPPVMRSSLIDTGKYTGSKAALDIMPFLALQPQFISGDKSYLDLALGLSVSFGEAYGDWMQSLSGAVTKRTDPESPLNYQVQYAGFLSSDAITHTRFTWPVNLYYSLYHDIVENNASDEADPYISDGLIVSNDKLSTFVRYSRYAASAAMPLPATRNSDLQLGAGFFLQRISQDYSRSADLYDPASGASGYYSQERTAVFRDAQQHRHYEANLAWSWSKGALATFLPSGGGVYAQLHKYWATYYNGDVTPFDSANAVKFAQAGEAAPAAVLGQSQFDPWTLELGTGGIYSAGRRFSLFANAEAGAFLNRFPVESAPADIRRTAGGALDTLYTGRQRDGLWVISYRLGYYRLSGYPYNFTYRGRDILEGSSYAFGQYGVQVPIKFGAFLPGLPVTSLKQFLVTAMGEWGTTLDVAPDRIESTLADGGHHLLLDFGLRLSMNFRLYHQLPFTVFAQGFVPYNRLKEENLYWFDYAHTGAPGSDGAPSAEQIANAPSDRRRHLAQVKEPRFFIGFNLGLF